MKQPNLGGQRASRWLGRVVLAWACLALPACGRDHGASASANDGTGAAMGSGGNSGGTAAGGSSINGGAGSGGGSGGSTGCANPVAVYTDADGDGYSLEKPGSVTPTCVTGTAPPGYTLTPKGWDCDDTNPQLTTHCPSRLVKDIDQVANPNLNSSPHAVAADGSGAYFAASDARNGTELWHTDFTAAGTHLVIDLAPGPTNSNPQLITRALDFTYFVATVPEFGAELWRTDGTPAKTSLVADLVPGPGSSTISAAANVNDRLYFVAQTTGATVDLWQTDGDAGSTKKVDLGGFTNPRLLTPLGSSIFFLADGAGGQALFRVDATGPTKVYPAGAGASNLTLLTLIGPSVYYVDHGLDIRKANEQSDALFYSMQSTVNGLSGSNPCLTANGVIEHLTYTASSKVTFDVHAYLTSGGPGCVSHDDIGQDYWYVSASGAPPVLLPGYGGVNNAYQDEQRTSRIAQSGGVLYFVQWTCPWTSGVCGSSGPGVETVGTKTLWKFDGTSAQQLLQMGYGAYFDALTPTTKSVFWLGPAGVSGGTPQGNQGDGLWLDGIVTGATAANGWSNLSPFAPVNGGGYLSATLGGHSGLYFMTAGSNTFTPLSVDVSVDVSNAGVVSVFQGLGSPPIDYLVFPGDDGTTGSEPWVTNGTSTGTALLKDINADPGSSFPEGFTELNGNVLFGANDGVTGYELWKSDGTSGGTVQVKDIWSGMNSSNPAALTAINGAVYFSANDGYTGTELWSTHGMVGDPGLVDDIFGGLMSTPMGVVPNASNPGPFVSFSGGVFFPATQGPATKVELFRYDGTGSPGPVTLVKAINPSGTDGSYPHALTVAGSNLFLVANDGTHGDQLWVTDGTGAGTVSLKQPSNPTDALNKAALVAVGQRLFFAAVDSEKGRELWSSDGTLAGTMLTDDINPSGDSDPDSFAVMGNTLYFAATDQAGDRELWSKLGSAPAERVADINSTGSSNPESLMVAGNLLFFAADDGVHGRELCVSQGSAATTTCFDIWPGLPGSNVSSIVAVDTGRVAFAASDGQHGVELWQSDGTAAGTVIVDDIAPGPSSSNPMALVWSPALWRVFFQADDGAKGVELRTISRPSLGP